MGHVGSLNMEYGTRGPPSMRISIRENKSPSIIRWSQKSAEHLDYVKVDSDFLRI